MRVFDLGIDLLDVDIAQDCASSGSSSSSPLPDNATSAERLKYIYTWFRGRGLTAIQAAAAVGNIAVESGGIPTRKQGAGIQTSNDPTSTGSLGWGLIQWSPGSKILTRAKQAGVTTPIYEMDSQLNIIYWLMTNTSEVGAKNMLKGFTQGTLGSSAYGYKDGAVYYFEDTMEGAGSPAYGARYNAAKIALEQYEQSAGQAYWDATHTAPSATPNNTWASSTSATAATATDPSAAAALSLSQAGCAPTSTSSVTGNFAQLVAAYTWPYEWRNSVAPDGKKMSATTMMPEYKTATATAKSKGLWIGSGGIDCGGFVTRIVQNSFDPTYNTANSGRGGNTATQLVWLRSHPDKWQPIPAGKDASFYKPGDVGIYHDSGTSSGHTLIFVGSIPTFWWEGTNGTLYPPDKVTVTGDMSGTVGSIKVNRVLLASASQDLRAPMADKDEVVGRSRYEWFRPIATNTSNAF